MAAPTPPLLYPYSTPTPPLLSSRHQVGDAIELTALKNVMGEGAARERDPRRERCAVGSIKSQIGHLKAVAGAAGMLKVILALKHKARRHPIPNPYPLPTQPHPTRTLTLTLTLTLTPTLTPTPTPTPGAAGDHQRARAARAA